jgi:hypothetical protein
MEDFAKSNRQPVHQPIFTPRPADPVDTIDHAAEGRFDGIGCKRDSVLTVEPIVEKCDRLAGEVVDVSPCTVADFPKRGPELAKIGPGAVRGEFRHSVRADFLIVQRPGRGAWLDFLSLQGLSYLRAHLKYLAQAKYETVRFEEEVQDRVRIQFVRGRPGTVKKAGKE